MILLNKKGLCVLSSKATIPTWTWGGGGKQHSFLPQLASEKQTLKGLAVDRASEKKKWGYVFLAWTKEWSWDWDVSKLSSLTSVDSLFYFQSMIFYYFYICSIFFTRYCLFERERKSMSRGGAEGEGKQRPGWMGSPTHAQSQNPRIVIWIEVRHSTDYATQVSSTVFYYFYFYNIYLR